MGASFGRGFYVLDDYSPLREVTPENMNAEAHLFPVKDAWWYIPRPVLGFGGVGSQGAEHFVAPNPEFGATLTYHLSEDYQSLEAKRRQKEKAQSDADIPFPGWEALQEEQLELKPSVYIVIQNDKGEVVRRLTVPGKKGLHRVAWDLRYPHTGVVRKTEEFGNSPEGLMVAPGEYTATLMKQEGGEAVALSESHRFTVKRLRQGRLEGNSTE